METQAPFRSAPHDGEAIDLANRLARQTHQLEVRNAELMQSASRTLAGMQALLCNLVDLYNPHLGGHGRRVAALVVEFGEALKLGPQALQSLRAAGLFHDLGMLGLRRERLYTPWAELSENERSLMLSHPEIGASQLELVPEWALTRAAVVAHHERWDGSGFPGHLTRDAIPFAARLLSICDTYDEMLNKPAAAPRRFSEDEVLEHLRRQRGRQHDPELVDRFLDMIALRGGVAGAVASHPEVAVMLDRAPTDVRLSRDIHNRAHLVLLAKGTLLRHAHLLRLRALRDEHAVVEPIYVVAPDAA